MKGETFFGKNLFCLFLLFCLFCVEVVVIPDVFCYLSEHIRTREAGIIRVPPDVCVVIAPAQVQHDINFHVSFCFVDKTLAGVVGNLQRVVIGIAVSAGRDQGKGYGLAMILLRQFQ